MYLTKSDFMLARDCPTKLFYKKKKYISSSGDDDLAQFLQDGAYMVSTMAKLLHPGGHEMVQGGAPKKASKATRDALAGGNTTLFEATVVYGHLRAQVDILQRVGDVLNLIEVTSSSIDGLVPDKSPFRGKRGKIDPVWRPSLEGVSFQAYILARAFPALTVVPYLCVVDKSRAATANSTYDNFRLNHVEASWPDVSYSGDVEALQHEHVLVTVNVSDEVNELLQSLVEQHYNDFEVIIVEDGSSVP